MDIPIQYQISNHRKNNYDCFHLYLEKNNYTIESFSEKSGIKLGILRDFSLLTQNEWHIISELLFIPERNFLTKFIAGSYRKSIVDFRVTDSARNLCSFIFLKYGLRFIPIVQINKKSYSFSNKEHTRFYLNKVDSNYDLDSKMRMSDVQHFLKSKKELLVVGFSENSEVYGTDFSLKTLDDPSLLNCTQISVSV